MSEVDRVVEMLDAGMRPALGALQRAAADLRTPARRLSLPEAVALVRVAVAIEKWERGSEAAPAVA